MDGSVDDNERRNKIRKEHGLDEMLEVEHMLVEAGITCCVVGARALMYYGSRLAAEDWQVCVPDCQQGEAARLFTDRGHLYEPGPQLIPQWRSLRHTYPSFHRIGASDASTFVVVPVSEWFVEGLDPSIIVRTRNGIPVPNLIPMAQSLVSTQHLELVVHIVDGMDLDEQWGLTYLRLGLQSDAEVRYVREKNEKGLAVHRDAEEWLLPACMLSEPVSDRTKEWQRIVNKKRDRIDPYANGLERYITRFRRKGSGDPRLRDTHRI